MNSSDGYGADCSKNQAAGCKRDTYARKSTVAWNVNGKASVRFS
jgi:hypothetical protein